MPRRGAVCPGTALVPAVLQVASGSSRSCGIVGTVTAHGFLDLNHRTPRCGATVATDCTGGLSSVQRLCPQDCAYLAPSSGFTCLLSCLRPGTSACSAYNLNRPFANNATKICEHCTVSACKACSARDRCYACHDEFELSADGRECRFMPAKIMHARTILKVVGGAILALVLLAVIYGCYKGGHPSARQHMLAIKRARQHRHACKVQDWNLFETSTVRTRVRYPIFMNVHKVNVIGLGFALFYNNVVFLVLVSLTCFIFTSFVFWDSAIRTSLVEFQAFTVMQHHFYGLSTCEYSASETIESNLHAFAAANFRMLCCLYPLLFCLSWLYGWYQKWHADWFESQNNMMEEYALEVFNLPHRNCLHEPELKRELQSRFKQINADVELVGVSICYAYEDRQDEVEEVMFRFMQRLDVAAGMYSEHPSVPEEHDKQLVKQWFHGAAPLKSSGSAFCVFRRKAHVRIVRRGLEQRPELLHWERVDNRNGDLGLREIYREPTAVNWQNYGIEAHRILRRVLCGMLRILATLVLLAVLLFVFIRHHLVRPFLEAGSVPSGHLMTTIGVLLGWVNMFLGIRIWQEAFCAGFKRKSSMDVLIFASNTTLVLLNTVFNIVTTISYFKEWQHVSVADVIHMRSLEAVGLENHAAKAIAFILVPGVLFLGLLMMPVMAGIIPYLWNTLLISVLYVWACLPPPLLFVLKAFLPWAPRDLDTYPTRSAEKGLEPLEIGLAWDYSNHIVIPSVCFCMLFFVSPNTWMTFAAMLCWSVFIYFGYRWAHLRFHKKAFYTTHYLDAAVHYAWGLPLSIVAAAWAFWGMRSGWLESPWWSPAAFLASFAAWLLVYGSLKPMTRRNGFEGKEEDPAYELTQADTVYSWFNTNPIFVLKCYFLPELVKGHLLPTGADGRTIVFYEAGKDYLFLDDVERQKSLSSPEMNDWLEIETYLDMLMDVLERLACPLRNLDEDTTEDTTEDGDTTEDSE